MPERVYKLVCEMGCEGESDPAYYWQLEDAIDVARRWVDRQRPKGDTRPVTQEPPRPDGEIRIHLLGDSRRWNDPWATIEVVVPHTGPACWWQESEGA